MSFLTRVKATGELFDATTDLGVDKTISRDAHLPLEATKFYEGHRLVGSVPNPYIIRFDQAVYAVFRGDELQVYPGEVRLLRRQ
jgi:hypothetical protein